MQQGIIKWVNKTEAQADRTAKAAIFFIKEIGWA